MQFIEEISSQSNMQLEEQLLEGLDSLERGEGIEATDEWWKQEHQFHKNPWLGIFAEDSETMTDISNEVFENRKSFG